MGPDSIARLEANVRSYLNVRETIAWLSRKLRSIAVKFFKIIRNPVIVTSSTVRALFVAGIMASLIGYNFSRTIRLVENPSDDLNEWIKSYGRSGPAWWGLSRLIGAQAVFWIALIAESIETLIFLMFVAMLFVLLGRNVFRYIFYETGKRSGVRWARRLSLVLYILALMPVIILYFCTLVLLTPYSLAEHLSVKFKLRPILGVFALILTTTAILLELSIML